MEKLLWGTEMRKGKLLRSNVIQEIQYSLKQCKFCNSISVVRYGLTAKGKQRFLCQKCKRTFVIADSPDGMHYSHDVIASAINQFYETSSLHKIKRQIELDYRVSPSHMGPYTDG
ncbi:IS1 family transposase [Chloroflexota bacterium]